ncbi:MAG: SDR family NAD(P)-dependent oxidoreductase [Alphaproteobacteria bacterium]
MKDFSGKLAVITGGGSGMGRALACQLAAEGCSVALCDISEANMAETRRIALQGAPQGVVISTFVADVADETRVEAFRDDTLSVHGLDHVHLLINNAGIGGGGSFVAGPRDQWERTFGVCWFGVYYMCRAFLPLVVKAPEGHVVNISSVNGFWARLGADQPHTSYSAAKFAVKGFTEALMIDLRVNAPHVKASVVMPGHIGTSIALNTMAEFGVPEEQAQEARAMGEWFRDQALTTADTAASIILDGVREDRWRILVGADAEALDRAVREAPENAYDPEFGLDIFALLRRE